MSKLAVAALVLTVLCSAVFCSDQKYVPGYLVNAGSRANPLLQSFSAGLVALPVNDENGNGEGGGTGPVNFCAGKFGPVCLNCHTLLTCADETINSQSCSSLNSAKPYCTGNFCAAEGVTNCNIPFRCTAAGIFPNPDDCTTYYFCTDASPQGSLMYTCPANYVFDSKVGMCAQKKVATDCRTINCAGNTNKYQVFAYDKSILAYCADTPAYKETVLFRCPDFENMEYDLDTLSCKFVCKAEGRFPDRLDCQKFYNCYKNGNVLFYEHQTCPVGYSYNRDKKMCVVQPTCSAEL